MPEPDLRDCMVVFDVDDTLYLEQDYVASGFAALEPLVARAFGVAGFASTAWQLFVDGNRGTIFDLALANLGVRAGRADIARLVAAYRNHRPTISLLPDAGAALATLRACGAHLGVVTDGPTASQAAKVAALDLYSLADAVILTDAYGPGFAKPHPRAFEELAANSGRRRCVYLADNPAKDFSAPRALGWTTVRVRRSGGLHEAVPHGSDVDRVVVDLVDLDWLHPVAAGAVSAPVSNHHRRS